MGKFKKQNGKPKGQKKGSKPGAPFVGDHGSKYQRRDEEIIDTAAREYHSGKNDPQWYSNNPQLLKDAGSFPFSNILGTSTQINDVVSQITSTGTTTTANHSKVFPGIMRLDFAPTIGVGSSAISAVNVAARNVYSFLRENNSGRTNYEAPDLMMYLLAMDSLNMFWAYLKRAYGIARHFSSYNRYYGDALISACGFNPQFVRSNLADLRYAINNMAVKMSALAIPKGMDLFERHEWMCSGLYLDSEANKAQTYLFRPEFFYQYTNLSANGTELVPVLNVGNGQITAGAPLTSDLRYDSMSDINVMISNLFTPIMMDEDFNIMSGDIMKAFGQNVKVYEQISEDYIVLPTFNREVLSQIENADILGLPLLGRTTSGEGVNYTFSDWFRDWKITQDPQINKGTLKTQYYIYYKSVQVESGSMMDYIPNADPTSSTTQFLNFHWDNPTPEDVVEATRLKSMCFYAGVPGTNGQITYSSCGAEVVLRGLVYTINPSAGDSVGMDFLQISKFGTHYQTGATLDVLLGMIERMNNFDWSPIMYYVKSASNVNTLRIFGDIDNYGAFAPEDITRLHDVAMLSLFYVPLVGGGSSTTK